MILLHDMADNMQTVEAIKTLIPELKRQGYEFVTIRDIFMKSGITFSASARSLLTLVAMRVPISFAV